MVLVCACLFSVVKNRFQLIVLWLLASRISFFSSQLNVYFLDFLQNFIWILDIRNKDLPSVFQLVAPIFLNWRHTLYPQ